MTTEPMPVSWWKFLARSFWIVLRVLLVIYLGQPGAKFFYQGF